MVLNNEFLEHETLFAETHQRQNAFTRNKICSWFEIKVGDMTTNGKASAFNCKLSVWWMLKLLSNLMSTNVRMWVCMFLCTACSLMLLFSHVSVNSVFWLSVCRLVLDVPPRTCVCFHIHLSVLITSGFETNMLSSLSSTPRPLPFMFRMPKSNAPKTTNRLMLSRPCQNGCIWIIYSRKSYYIPPVAQRKNIAKAQPWIASVDL